MNSPYQGAPPAAEAPQDGDPRRCHPTWDLLAERQGHLCEGLAHLASTWAAVEVLQNAAIAKAKRCVVVAPPEFGICDVRMKADYMIDVGSHNVVESRCSRELADLGAFACCC